MRLDFKAGFRLSNCNNHILEELTAGRLGVVVSQPAEGLDIDTGRKAEIVLEIRTVVDRGFSSVENERLEVASGGKEAGCTAGRVTADDRDVGRSVGFGVCLCHELVRGRRESSTVRGWPTEDGPGVVTGPRGCFRRVVFPANANSD